jgi:hypothetical protein
VLGFSEVISPAESRVTVVLVAACAELSAPTEKAPAKSAVAAAVATARNAKFLFMLIFLLIVWTARAAPLIASE